MNHAQIQYHALWLNKIGGRKAKRLDVFNQRLEDLCFEKANLPYAVFCGVAFKNCTFEDCLFDNTLFENCTFEDCCFEFEKFKRSQVKNCLFKEVFLE